MWCLRITRCLYMRYLRLTEDIELVEGRVSNLTEGAANEDINDEVSNAR